ncbi:hypothetical protein [Pseudarthrobacter oxydans]|jgi:hypothetical protein|uniref:hypothetical protein n=1 Tax=Pseudarthrobacter oxydans TaxID=1671 RepID=UPI00344C5CDF
MTLELTLRLQGWRCHRPFAAGIAGRTGAAADTDVEHKSLDRSPIGATEQITLRREKESN